MRLSHREVLPEAGAMWLVRDKHTVFSSLEPCLLAGTPMRDKSPAQTALKSSNTSRAITTSGRKCARTRPAIQLIVSPAETSASPVPIPMFAFPIGNTIVVEEARKLAQLPTETRMPLLVSYWQ